MGRHACGKMDFQKAWRDEAQHDERYGSMTRHDTVWHASRPSIPGMGRLMQRDTRHDRLSQQARCGPT